MSESFVNGITHAFALIVALALSNDSPLMTPVIIPFIPHLVEATWEMIFHPHLRYF
jgi:hypothetical protein